MRGRAWAMALALGWPAIGAASPAGDGGPVITLHPALHIATAALWGPDEGSPAELTLYEARVLARGVVAAPGADPTRLGDTPHVGYFLQLQTLASPAILDARLTAALDRALRVEAGLTKVPISDEWLVPAPELDLRQRSRLARFIAPRRGVGVQIAGSVADGAFGYVAGAYDQDSPRGAAEAPPIYAARVDGTLDLGPAALRLGAAGGLQPLGDDTDRIALADANLRLDLAGLWLTAEVLFARFEPPADATSDPTASFGAVATVGYALADFRALARYDHFTDALTTDAALIVALGWSPLSPVLVQVEYESPVEGASPAVLAAYARLAFTL
ncbi:MAG: hypothetical protein R3F65_26180 [bacterium]|nr:hypothetical protein [Myxococcales bacterium]